MSRRNNKVTPTPTPTPELRSEPLNVDIDSGKERPFLLPEEFNGVVHTVVTDRHPQGFPNYRLVTLHIVNGVVARIERVSDRYAAQEAMAHLDVRHENSFMSINRTYPTDRKAREGFRK